MDGGGGGGRGGVGDGVYCGQNSAVYSHIIMIEAIASHVSHIQEESRPGDGPLEVAASGAYRSGSQKQGGTRSDWTPHKDDFPMYVAREFCVLPSSLHHIHWPEGWASPQHGQAATRARHISSRIFPSTSTLLGGLAHAAPQKISVYMEISQLL